ncbi:MAG: NUDIX domain-containing protein [Patescibacteria group bacterium]
MAEIKIRYKFCPVCAGQLKNTLIPKEGRTRLNCQSCGFIFYQNPKATAGVVIVKNGRVLLGKKASGPKKGQWNIPGGFLEAGEHPLQGAKREVKEETGLNIRIVKLLDIFKSRYYTGDHCVNIFYLAEIISGTPKAGDDLGELKWFEPNKLPKKMAFKDNEAALKAWLRQNKDYKS